MIEIVLLVFSIINLFFLLGLWVLEDESDLRDN